MSQRGLPPDRLNFERNSWEIDGARPSLRDGSIRIEESDVAPAFGQPSGGLHYRFLEGDSALSQAQLVERGIITKMDDLRVHPTATDAPAAGTHDFWAAAPAAAIGTHAEQSLDRFLSDYALPLEVR